jgi:sortase A
LVFAVVAIAAGSAVGAYAIWLRFSASAAPDASQLARTRQLALALASPPSSKGSSARPTPRPGDPVAVVRIPALGRTWQYPVYEGTQDAELNKGLAHYSGTAEPGAVGNFAIAGHRSSVSGFEPFADLPDLVRPGNEIVVTAAGGVFKYTAVR